MTKMPSVHRARISTSTIPYLTHVWNPTVGCSPASDGCENCYARQLHNMRHHAFLGGNLAMDGYARPFSEVRVMEERIGSMPQGVKKRIGVGFMGDLFHESVPDKALKRILEATVYGSYSHDMLLLTKRPERMQDACAQVLVERRHPCEGIWLGVTAEDQLQADRRLPIITDWEWTGLQHPNIWVSVEPMLGPIYLGEWLQVAWSKTAGRYESSGFRPELSWVVCGPETGPNARPFELAWAEDLREQCRAAKVPFYFKGHGLPREMPNFVHRPR